MLCELKENDMVVNKRFASLYLSGLLIDPRLALQQENPNVGCDTCVYVFFTGVVFGWVPGASVLDVAGRVGVTALAIVCASVVFSEVRVNL